ncbi:MAG: TlpA family protein disulfide reductase [Myxococcales bacterium]|nr:TlpA family protein disulfide reductase [Myxococcales bacterium]
MGRGTLLLAVVLAFGSALALLFEDRGVAPLEVGDVAPPLGLPRIGPGEPLDIEDARGQVVFLNFWATWCKPCEDEMPAMERLHRELGPKGLAMWAVSVDDRAEPVAEFRERLGLTFPILHDPAKEASERYDARRFPESWIVGRDGRLVARFIGPREWDSPVYLEQIAALLDETGP